MTVFDQKPWAIAHGFEHDGFWQVLEFAPNYLNRVVNAWKWISNTLLDYLCRFRVNSRGTPIDRFWPKTLGYSPWFWTWRILASSGIRSKLRCWTICVQFERIHEGRKLTVFDQKPWAIAHGFEHDGFWQVLEFAPNSVKRLLSAWKWISNTLQDYLCRIRTNSRGLEIDRCWPKTLGYSPWFWKWRILASSGIRSKLRETPPKCLKMDF